MTSVFNRLAPILLSVGIIMPVFTTGCTVHAGVYDRYHQDHHVWATEQPYYSQWEHDTHRQDKDFKKRSSDEQKDYWDWRHKQDDHHDDQH